MPVDLRGKRVLVTGGTGFIGGRLVERLVLERGSQVRVLIRNFAKAARIARLPIQMTAGTITDPADVERAMAGCEIVFHCACDTRSSAEIQRSSSIDGTRNILESALRAGVKKVVYLSTVAVYGPTPDGDLDETAPRKYVGSVYSDSKLDAEKLVIEYAKNRNLPAVVLQPTIVYGPNASTWTTGVLRQLRKWRAILVNGGEGLCNAVYIDDLVTAMLLAAESDKAIGETFLISGEQPVTWREFYSRHEQMLGFNSTISLPASEAAKIEMKPPRLVPALLGIVQDSQIQRRILSTTEMQTLKKAARTMLPQQVQRSLKTRFFGRNGSGAAQSAGQTLKPICPIGGDAVQFMAAKTRIRIDKAKRVLGYGAQFDFESGMSLTEQWARWANLI
jgi:nucleoside-diphosphate-sugar epimerase